MASLPAASKENAAGAARLQAGMAIPYFAAPLRSCLGATGNQACATRPHKPRKLTQFLRRGKNSTQKGGMDILKTIFEIACNGKFLKKRAFPQLN
jgi:hypothetical protein